MKRTTVWGFVATIAPLLGACASMDVTDDVIVSNTSRALGLNKSHFTISDRADSSVQTTYTARTKSGSLP